MKSKILTKIKKAVETERLAFSLLLSDFSPICLAIFTLSIVSANLFANKEMFNYQYFSLDCGTAFSWMMFLCMDITCKHYGAGASIRISLLALFFDLLASLVFFLLSLIPSNWGEFYETGEEIANKVLNGTFSSSLFVVLGSATAFTVSAVANALLNKKIEKSIVNSSKISGFPLFAIQSYTSTFLAQYIDNFTFSVLVSRVLFGWNMKQVIFCSLSQATIELLSEVIFSPLGYKITCGWKKRLVGEEYKNRFN